MNMKSANDMLASYWVNSLEGNDVIDVLSRLSGCINLSDLLRIRPDRHRLSEFLLSESRINQRHRTITIPKALSPVTLVDTLTFSARAVIHLPLAEEIRMFLTDFTEVDAGHILLTRVPPIRSEISACSDGHPHPDW